MRWTSHEDAADDVSSTVQTASPVASGGLLSRIFGSHQETVQQGVQQASGLSFEKVKHLLMMLSPVVLSAAARHTETSSAQANPDQLGNALQREAQKAQSESPHLGGLLGNLLGAI